MKCQSVGLVELEFLRHIGSEGHFARSQRSRRITDNGISDIRVGGRSKNMDHNLSAGSKSPLSAERLPSHGFQLPNNQGVNCRVSSTNKLSPLVELLFHGGI